MVAIIAATDEASTATQRGCIARLRRGRLLPREPNMIIVDTAGVLTRELPNRMEGRGLRHARAGSEPPPVAVLCYQISFRAALP